MSITLNPYLSFRDNARDAMEFYRSVLGGKLTLSTFAEFQASEDPGERDKIMHGMLVSDSGLTLMGADTPNNMQYTPGGNFSVSLSGDDEATATHLRRHLGGRNHRDAAGTRALGRRLRNVFGQIRRQLAGQYRPRPVIAFMAG